jgi:RHS repeat-associated protein
LISKHVTKCAAENLNVLAMPTNQIAGYGYDAAGNMTQDVTTGLAYVYDAENRIASVNGTTYVYDADDNRVEKSSGGTGRLYWHMSPGVVAETDLAGNLQAEYLFFNRQRIARKDFPSTSVSYYFSDQLKTAAVISDSAGNIKSESDYYPWGGELQVANGDTNHFKWTGHERDSESGLDYFGARYYGNGLSRFTSADSVGNDWEIADPQRWNLYTYARNNPLKYVDDLGEELKFADKELEAIVTQIRGESSDFNDALKGFEGKGAPDLTFQFGDAGKDANGIDPATGVTKSTFQEGGTFLTCSSATDCKTEQVKKVPPS